MKKSVTLLYSISIAVFLLALFSFFSSYSLTGKVIQMGPSDSELSCMMSCMKCTAPGEGCTGNQDECQTKCNLIKPEQTEDEKCVESCVLVGCSQYDFKCQSKNQEECDKQCNMVQAPEVKSEEEQCIRDCVEAEAPGTICQAAQGGEQGNDLCKRCAEKCKYLYVGPCLDEEKLEAKKKECMTCDKCYASPIMGDSGEGYECIINVECKDASSEFGDNPGTGEGIIPQIGETIGNAVENVIEFFSNLF